MELQVDRFSCVSVCVCGRVGGAQLRNTTAHSHAMQCICVSLALALLLMLPMLHLPLVYTRILNWTGYFLAHRCPAGATETCHAVIVRRQPHTLHDQYPCPRPCPHSLTTDTSEAGRITTHVPMSALDALSGVHEPVGLHPALSSAHQTGGLRRGGCLTWRVPPRLGCARWAGPHTPLPSALGAATPLRPAFSASCMCCAHTVQIQTHCSRPPSMPPACCGALRCCRAAVTPVPLLHDNQVSTLLAIMVDPLSLNSASQQPSFRHAGPHSCLTPLVQVAHHELLGAAPRRRPTTMGRLFP